MKGLATRLGVSILLLASAIFLGWSVATVSGLSTAHARNNVGGAPMHKVQLTQKGYIQFLRWELPVPEIHEYTFCLWVKSNDLKHPHSIFSYSKNERERLIRSWISSRGRSIHLEINGGEVFRRPVDIREHRWYHICQSWENRVGRYALWIDGRLELQGHSVEMIDHVIPAGGDIVLGQEYTDFDKGLEEGIEGSVLGFNLLLASAFDPLDSGYQRPSFQPAIVAANPAERSSAAAGFRARITEYDLDLGGAGAFDGLVLGRYALGPNWSRRISRSDDARTTASSPARSRGLSSQPLNVTNDDTRRERLSPDRVYRDIALDRSAREINAPRKSPDAPLGLQLVKLSYVRCQLGRGSPPVGGSLMLISWSRTPVRVFGGAVIKNVGNECGDF